MSDAAKLITAIAALLAAIAWPILIAAVILTFRSELRSAFSRFPDFLDRVREMKIAGIEAKLGALADKAKKNGEITAEQAETAAQLAVDSRSLGAENLYHELDKLCLQFDTVRRSMAPGPKRTMEMTRIVVKMRALALSTSDRIEVYKSSGSAGSRLAAVTMMQMDPRKLDLSWLLDRFKSDAPFVFYHAALALNNAATHRTGREREEVLEACRKALDQVKSFSGVPDRETINVLQAVLGK